MDGGVASRDEKGAETRKKRGEVSCGGFSERGICCVVKESVLQDEIFMGLEFWGVGFKCFFNTRI